MIPINWCDLNEKDIYREIMKRPGLYVGSPRLDSVIHFVNGFLFGGYQNGANRQSWNADLELQYWMLMKQSVAIRHRATINGFNLFMKNYGVGKMALQQFVSFLHTDEKDYEQATEAELVSESIYKEVSQRRRQIEQGNVTKNQCKLNIIETIEEIILSSGEEADCVRLYLYRENLYSQARFIIHTSKGWVDDMSLIKPEHFYKLIQLHTYQECLNNHELYRLVDITECAGAKIYTNVYVQEEMKEFFFEDEEKRQTLYEMYHMWHLDRTGSY